MNNSFGNSGFGNSGFGNSGFGNNNQYGNNQYGNSPFGNNNQYGNDLDQAILEAYDDDMDIQEEGFGDIASLPIQQPRRSVTFSPVARNLSNRNDDSVMSLDEQEQRIHQERQSLIARGLNPRDYMRRNQFGQNATNHGYSGSAYREVDYGPRGNIVNNDPHGLWTPKGYKERALQDLRRNENIVESTRPLYNQNRDWLNQGRVTRDSQMVINGIPSTVGSFMNMYENSKDSIPSPRPHKLGGKKSKKNRKTKGKKKQRRKTNKHRKKLKK
jgi:hypothetical protein